MIATDAVRALVRKGDDHQLRSQISVGRAEGMMTMEQSLAELVRASRITATRPSRTASAPTICSGTWAGDGEACFSLPCRPLRRSVKAAIMSRAAACRWLR